MTTPSPASSAGVPQQQGRRFDLCPCRSDMSLAAVESWWLIAHQTGGTAPSNAVRTQRRLNRPWRPVAAMQPNKGPH